MNACSVCQSWHGAAARELGKNVRSPGSNLCSAELSLGGLEQFTGPTLSLKILMIILVDSSA